MSTNAYDSEQRISFGDPPKSYFGFYMSGTSYRADVHPFDSAEQRDRFIAEVVAPVVGGDDWLQRTCAAALCLALWDPDDNSFEQWMPTVEMLADESHASDDPLPSERLIEAGEKFREAS